LHQITREAGLHSRDIGHTTSPESSRRRLQEDSRFRDRLVNMISFTSPAIEVLLSRSFHPNLSKMHGLPCNSNVISKFIDSLGRHIMYCPINQEDHSYIFSD
jgi:hypothetical protein